MTRMIFAFWTLLAGLTANAGLIGANCPYKQEISQSTVASQYFTTVKGCLLQITPLNKPDLVYREYVIDERGGFQIFNSLTGDYETSTGTRTYFFFPRRQAPTFTVLPDGRIRAVLAGGSRVTFNNSPPRLADFEGAKFSEGPTVRLDDQGGVEFSSFSGIWLDVGWQIGGSALQHPERSSVFHDSHGNSCALKNTQIVDYASAEYGEPLFLAQTDAELARFLAQLCPALDTQTLKETDR